MDPALLVPMWLKAHVPEEIFLRLVDSFQKRPPVWLRARKGHTEKIRLALERAGVRPAVHPSMPEAISFDGSINLDLVRRETDSAFEVQDLASQRVGLACAPRSGESWWDACAGAGGKSLHLADLMENRGQILATDIREDALKKLEDRARRAKAAIIKTSTRQPLHELFDGVLVDAPCSGIGTWSRNPDARWRTSEEMITEKSTVQRNLLETAAARVKPGGKLVYAVCTLTRKETTEITDSFLQQHPEFAPIPQSPNRPTLQIWPWEGPCDGMFISVMAKQGHRSNT
jgi:16S rRNA (cytosine967-C5)-methyltransferase